MRLTRRDSKSSAATANAQYTGAHEDPRWSPYESLRVIADGSYVKAARFRQGSMVAPMGVLVNG